MSEQRSRRRRIPEYQAAMSFYEHAAVERFSKHAANHYVLEGNFIGANCPGPCSRRKLIEFVAANARSPIPIESIVPPSALLDDLIITRCQTFFGVPAVILNQLVGELNMQWWISDVGLNVGVVLPQPDVSKFVEIAGKLMNEHFSTHDRLKRESLLTIARELDESGCDLLDNMQPAFRRKLATFNIRHPKVAVKTFQQAVNHDQFGRRAVQRALYSAREKSSRATRRSKPSGQPRRRGGGAF